MSSITEKIASTHLGQKSTGSKLYDKSLLVAVPRRENREQYNIDENNLPFVGYDTWHAYEAYCTTTNGIPVMGAIKIVYPSNNQFIVESKSLKLYLNSFNLTPVADTIDECKNIYVEKVKSDLSELLKTDVEVNWSDEEYKDKSLSFFVNIYDLVNSSLIAKTEEKEDVETLILNEEPMDCWLRFPAVRSNCRVTHQPDFAQWFIRIKSKNSISYENLIRYVASFKGEFHFHEEATEMCYKRLYDVLNTEELLVIALYTRRGGIDICPQRANKESLLNKCLIDSKRFAKNTINQ